MTIRTAIVCRADDENARDLLGILADSDLLDISVVTPALNYAPVPGVPQERIYHLQPSWPPAVPLDAYNPYRRVIYRRVFDEIDPDLTLSFGQTHLRFVTAVGDVTPTVFLPQGGETDQAVGTPGFGVTNLVGDPFATLLEEYLLRPLYRRRFRRFLGHVEEVWTQGYAADTYQSLGLDPGRFRDFDWGPVDTETFHPGVDPVEYADADTTVVGTFRRFRDIEMLGPSYETFLDAFGALADRQSDVHLVVGGYGFADTPVRDLIDERIRRHGIEERVTRLDVVPKSEMPAHYAGLDIYVNPTFSGSSVGGVGTCSKEAMACGCAFVSFDDPPMGYLVDDGRNGFLFDHGQSGTLARTLERLHESPQELADLKQAARKTVVERFSPAVVRQEFERRCAAVVDGADRS